MALDFTTYDGLIAAIAETLNRSDLTGAVPGWIRLAEEGHKTDLRIREMLTRTTTQITGRTTALPSGFVKFKRLRVSAESAGYPYRVDIVPADEMPRYWRSTAAGAGALAWPDSRPINLPRYVSIAELLEWDVDPSEYTGMTAPYAQMLYWKAFTALSAASPSNALLVRAPGAYFYGALVHSAPYLLNDERIDVWRGEYASIVARLNLADRDAGGPLVSRAAGRTP